MADSFTSSLRQRLQQTGANNNVWGGLLNAAALQLLEDAVSGRVVITVAGADITLSTNLGANDQARYAILSLQGAPGATRNIIVPAVSKIYVVENLTANDQTVKTPAGTGVAVPAGNRVVVMCDGTNVVTVGSDLSLFARLASRNAFSAGNSEVIVTIADGATVTMDLALGNVFKVTLGGNRTLAITNPNDGSWADLYVIQDPTGGRTLSFPATIVWEGGAAPTVSPIASSATLVQVRYDADTTNYYGRAGSPIISSGGGTVAAFTLDKNENNIDVFARAGSPAGAATITLTINRGVLISSLVVGTPALDFSGFVAGSIINIINNGYIIGRGGEGGNGGGAGGFSGNDPYAESGRAGKIGGEAIRLPSTACTINITNSAGFIWGGGGGGGGGGGTSSTNADNLAAGGGGGGGAGGGRGGQGMSFRSNTGAEVATGTHGTDGTTGRTGVLGAKGIGNNFGTADGGDGGDGGDFGAAGAVGESPTAQSLDAVGGAAGGAGKAVNVNGGTAPVFVSGSGAPNVKGAVA